MEPVIHIKMDLALNNQQGLICHKTQQTIQTNQVSMNHISILADINNGMVWMVWFFLWFLVHPVPFPRFVDRSKYTISN